MEKGYFDTYITSHNSNKNRTLRDLGQETAQNFCLLTDVCQNKIMRTEASSGYTYPLTAPSYLKAYHRCDQAKNLDIMEKNPKQYCELRSDEIDGDKD